MVMVGRWGGGGGGGGGGQQILRRRARKLFTLEGLIV